ncbi:LysR family transcriptional regulator [Sphingomonas sp. DBB INV C78]|uniref:LysR family transcriptional regulator n=1 Tax=Sphingomonas sp. DBB INV C78 TaxID=3349434 RepID=UPI0036D35D2C
MTQTDPSATVSAMDWDNLRVFLAAVHAGNYSAAAKRLRIDRTTVGRKLDRLERQLGVRLFEQGAEGYHPTAAGRRALEIADAMERLTEGLAGELRDEASQPMDRLRIAVAAELETELMPDIAAFAAAADRPVQVSIQSTADPAESVVQRKSDIGLCLTDHRPDHLRGRRIGTLRQAPYASRAYLARHGDGRPAAAYDWVRCSGWSRLPAMRRWDAALGDDVGVAALVDSWPALRRAVELDVGVAYLWTFIADRLPHLAAVAPVEDSLGADLWILVRDDVPMDRPTRAFMEDMTTRLDRLICPESAPTPP